MDTIYGKNAVFEALKSKRKVYEMIIQDGFRDENFIQLARKNNAKITTKTRKEMDKIADKHQGVILIVEGYSYKNLDYILSNIKHKYPFIVLLEGIEDPHNLGAVSRSAFFFGADCLIADLHNSCPVNDTVHKTSAGASLGLKYLFTKLSAAINALQDASFTVYAAVLDHDAQKITDTQFSGRSAILLGSEGRGIRRHLREMDIEKIFIPRVRTFNSLNVSCAASVLLYEYARQINISKKI